MKTIVGIVGSAILILLPVLIRRSSEAPTVWGQANMVLGAVMMYLVCFVCSDHERDITLLNELRTTTDIEELFRKYHT
jgi:hypothetical protein